MNINKDFYIEIVYSKKINNSSFYNILELCKNNQENTNYSIDWKKYPNSILHALIEQDRFSKENGGMVLLYNNRKLIALSGYNRSPFDYNIFLLGSRTLVDKDYRNNQFISSYIIPTQINESKKLGAKICAFTFDVTNKFSLYNVFINNKLRLLLKNKIFDSYENLQALNHTVNIYNTEQNVLYIELENYKYDWTQLHRSQ